MWFFRNDTPYIRAMAGSGPYTLSLFAKDMFYTDYRNVLTDAYDANDLAAPSISFSGDFIVDDMAMSVFSEGDSSSSAATYLDITIPVEIWLEGEYTVSATLWCNNTIFVGASEVVQTMDVATHYVTLTCGIHNGINARCRVPVVP